MRDGDDVDHNETLKSRVLGIAALAWPSPHRRNWGQRRVTGSKHDLTERVNSAQKFAVTREFALSRRAARLDHREALDGQAKRAGRSDEVIEAHAAFFAARNVPAASTGR